MAKPGMLTWAKLTVLLQKSKRLHVDLHLEKHLSMAFFEFNFSMDWCDSIVLQL